MEIFIFPAADGRINLSGRDQELRTPTLIRDRPIQGESHRDFLGETEGSLPPPQDSLPDAGEAINDFWSMSGNFIYHHHVEPRVKLYSPREASFPIPLNHTDVSRTTRTNWDVMQETSRRMYVVWRETDKTAVNIQARLFMARALDKIGKKSQAEGESQMVQ